MSTVVLTQEKHIIHKQNEQEEQILRAFRSNKKDYTLTNPLIEVNPYLISPLTALVLFTTKKATKITAVVKGKNEANNVVHTFAADTEHILPIYGLYLNQSTEVELRDDSGETSTLHIQTEEELSPEHLPKILDLYNQDNYLDDNWMFLTPTSKHFPVAYDNAGDIRWYTNTNLSFDLKRLKNGHLLVGTDRLLKNPYYISGIYEMDLSGKIYKEFRMPGGYHHDTQELSDGNIIVLSEEADAATVEDTMILIDRETGDILYEWDFKNMFPKEHSGSGSYSAEDWCHANSLVYNEERDEVLISARHLDAIFCFSYETGELKFIIGDPEGWDEEFVESYFFTTMDDSLEWNYEQHGLQLTAEGNLMFFDNGHWRSKNPEKYLKNADNYSRGVLYGIDRENRQVRQLYQYGKERGAEYFSPYISNVVYYEKDRYLVHSGGIGYKDGQPLEGLSTRHMFDNDVDVESVTTELYKDEVMFELKIAANMYRARKLPPYFASENFEEGLGEVLGELAETEIMTTEVPYEKTTEPIPDKFEAEFVEEYDRYRFTATYESGQLALLILNNGEETLRYFISTGSDAVNALCIGTFIKDDPRIRDLFVNKKGLNGEYDVYFYVDGTLYDTDLTFSE